MFLPPSCLLRPGLTWLHCAWSIAHRRSNSDGATPLLRACEGGNPQIVELLLARGADPEAETNDGRNAMHIACQFQWRELVEVLLDHGVPKCTLRSCERCRLTLKLLERKRKRGGKGGKKGEKTAAEKQAAVDAAMAAFEREFGTFEDLAAEEDDFAQLEAEHRNSNH